MMVTQFMDLLIHLRVFTGLMTKDINDLWIQADFDGNSLKQFQVTFLNDDIEANGNQEQTIGFSVKNTSLFLSEVEEGV
ncbi:unnamed protein product [Brassica oleracea var. botrytis]|uniref:Uncharacterized protein n=1 Tax=Brassica oleracea TaxID=3712 RepID=A0A3P6AJ08_BRAOL|nr:unnamed protein product [Brassica oleracea]